MVTDKEIGFALDNQYDGMDKFLLVQEILQLQAEVEKLKKAIKNWPYDEHSRAEMEGLDGVVAWDSFCEAMQEWKESALKGK